MTTLQGRTAIVSGSGRGIGAAVAHKLAAHGANVVVNDLDEAVARATAAEITAVGGSAVACPGNVTEVGFAQRFVDTAVDSFGGLDIIVNNAGYTWDGVVQKMGDEQWDAILDVHLKAPFQILRAAQPVISAAAKRESAAGNPVTRKVVNISSLAGLYGNAGQANYSAGKAGILGLTKAIAKEWGRYRVTVNAVAFGLIETRLTSSAEDAETIEIEGREITVGVNPMIRQAAQHIAPLGRLGTPEEAAGAVYLLCLPESDYITGEVLACSGGLVG
ncbi:3-oxoacyl-ACP reductase [Tsukamurella pulmonis]|uniref:3-oxoacyl-[acyl-carrier-protein] reductase MabA n=1 Tax=Tsukamurella pulmonis TaxID=47312 RepID=A0A1H1AZD2_9ACTN|nr:SDR family oxidoreductase [Tsukamurella pulmonis]KXO94214.1 3-oxoacyl-ACP reductase [Tsukamurella pulmonis]KXP08126.1 3-oxoacyl-ACP reductase [Tsukamurella pulmonis]RDH10993.1 SDR family oxidoreductase [Tsukamurella pulmonis]SDQ45068.1 3-oxoacyl-[acyl-carrier protein] reductase [Tsukamurella pulmonis]